MNRYLAEVYLAHVGEFEATTSPVGAATRAISRNGARVRHLRSIFVPEDQTCFLLFAAGSPSVVQQVAERAGLQLIRVVAAMEGVGSEHRERRERSVRAEEFGSDRSAATEKGEER